MTRAITATELAYVGTSGQHSKLFLAFPDSHIIFSAQVNGSPATDSMVSLPYHTITYGAYADIKFGMTVWIGTVAGGYDLGIARVRKAADASNIYVGITSDLHVSNGKYITVVDDFLPWDRRLLSNSDITCLMDYDIAFSDQYSSPYPFPCMGADAVIYVPDSIISGGNTASITFDGTAAFAPTGTISSRSWGYLGSNISVSNGTTDTPTYTVSVTGTWKVYCSVVANGKTSVGWRTLVVYDQTHPPVSDFQLTKSPTADRNGTGWSFEVKLYDSAAFASVKDRQQVILFSRDWYGDKEISLGPLTGRENIWCIGWIDKQTMHYEDSGAYVTFAVEGTAHWLDQMSKQIFGIRDWDGTVDDWHVADWINYPSFTANKGLAALLYWQSCIAFIADVYLLSTDQEIPEMVSSPGSIWAQIKEFTGTHLLAQPNCNRYGQLYIEVDTQYIPSASRGAFPIVMSITSSGVKKGSMDIVRETVPKYSQVYASGVSYTWADIGIGQALFALAPGHVSKQFGSVQTLEMLYLTSQAHLNSLASLYIAQANNPYPEIPISLLNNRFVDVCPHQYIYLTRIAADNPRSISFVSNIVPDKVTLNFDNKTGLAYCEIVGEAATTEDSVVNGDIPIADDPSDPSYPLTPIVPPIYAPIPWPTLTSPTFPTMPTFPGYPMPGQNLYYPSFVWIVSSPSAAVLPGPAMTAPRLGCELITYAWGGTVTFNMEMRSNPSSTGSKLFVSDVVATSTPTAYAIDSPTLPLGEYLIPVIVSKTSTPTYLMIQLVLWQ